MSPAADQFANFFKQMPLSRKIFLVATTLLLILILGTIIYMNHQVQYTSLYNNLSSQDAAAIVTKLKEQKIEYKIIGDGSVILVPVDKVSELRLQMAQEGLPKGTGVGFEIFNQTNFGETEFVQRLNYQRALQGELARTIQKFDEVEAARVMIVLPKDSVFIEESKPPSASVLLELRSRLSPNQVNAIVHYVSSAVQGMTDDMVTVVDTKGNVLSKKTTEDEKASELADKQLDYKNQLEHNLAHRIQSMLERIVGQDHAIVRVSADLDFDQVDINEEVYDPDGRVVRSEQNQTETLDRNATPTSNISSVNPVAGQGTSTTTQNSEKSQKGNQTTNYEISRTVTRTSRPMARLNRLSVAAVVDQKYETVTDKNGNTTKKSVPRTQQEIQKFMAIVQNAMGYSADREDQVTVEQMPFSDLIDASAMTMEKQNKYLEMLKDKGQFLLYILLLFLAFLLIVNPIRKTAKEVAIAESRSALPPGEAGKALPGGEDRQALPEPKELSPREKAGVLARQDMDKTANLIKGWIGEAT